MKNNLKTYSPHVENILDQVRELNEALLMASHDGIRFQVTSHQLPHTTSMGYFRLVLDEATDFSQGTANRLYP